MVFPSFVSDGKGAALNPLSPARPREAKCFFASYGVAYSVSLRQGQAVVFAWWQISTGKYAP